MRPTRPSAPVLPCTPAVFQRPQQPAARHRWYRLRHPLGGIDYPHTHRQAHPGICSRRPCPCRPTSPSSWSRMGSKDTLQCPAPRCSRTSTIRCMRLPQSDPVGNGIVGPSGPEVSMRRGWQPPTRFSGRRRHPGVGSTRGLQRCSEPPAANPAVNHDRPEQRRLWLRSSALSRIPVSASRCT